MSVPVDETPEQERRRVFGACGGKCGEAPCIAWNKQNAEREAHRRDRRILQVKAKVENLTIEQLDAIILCTRCLKGKDYDGDGNCVVCFLLDDAELKQRFEPIPEKTVEPVEPSAGTGWLLELGMLTLGLAPTGELSWIPFTYPAVIRFARKIDAENMKAGLQKPGYDALKDLTVSEHLWMDMPPPVPAAKLTSHGANVFGAIQARRNQFTSDGQQPRPDHSNCPKCFGTRKQRTFNSEGVLEGPCTQWSGHSIAAPNAPLK